jgi:phage antirepressor YoqD-like protein
MANEIKIFENPEFGKLRTIETNGVMWFHAADACKVLGFANPTSILKSRINEKDRAIFDIGHSAHNFVNESGLYALILGSRKPEAEQFKHWVTSDVLPSIRSTGAYMTDNALDRLMEDPDTFIRLLTEYKAEKQKRILAEKTTLALTAKVEQDEPKVLFADSVAASHQSILIGELAKFLRQNGVEVGQNRLFDSLRNNGYLIKAGESRNIPTQYSMEMGLFEIKERSFIDPNGAIHITKTTKVTGKGQVYFVNKFLKGEIKP